MMKINEMYQKVRSIFSEIFRSKCEFNKVCKYSVSCVDPEYYDGIGMRAYCGKFRQFKYGGDS